MDKSPGGLMTKITYIYNSCYHIETENHQVLIDYFTGKVDLNPDKPTTFIVTHGHSDHFDPFIFEMGKDGDHYLLSDDLKEEVEAVENITFVVPHEEGSLHGLTYKTSGSTDQGISIYFEMDGKTFLHAGDLNLWIWPEDSEEENKQMTEDFKREVSAFKDLKPQFSFFPVDARLDDDIYQQGPLHFIKEVKPEKLFPMHFREHWDVLNRFDDEDHGDSEFIHLETENQSFEY